MGAGNFTKVIADQYGFSEGLLKNSPKRYNKLNWETNSVELMED